MHKIDNAQLNARSHRTPRLKQVQQNYENLVVDVVVSGNVV